MGFFFFCQYLQARARFFSLSKTGVSAKDLVNTLPEKELAFVGVPYLDAMLERLKTAEPLPPHPLTVLVAPSWGPSSLFGHYGSRILKALLDTGYHIIVRPHPQSYTAEKDMLESLGFQVYCIDSMEMIGGVIDEIQRT